METTDLSDETVGNQQRTHKIRLCVVATVDISIQNLFRGRLEYLIGRGFEITVVCAPTPMAAEIEARGLRLHTAPLTRAVTPLRDVAALWNLWRFFRRERFDIVELSTPKAALLGSIAARLAAVPCIVHILHGLAYQTQSGLMLRVLKTATALPVRLADHTICVSRSVREQARRDGIRGRDDLVILNQGSANGIDLDRFAHGDAAQRARVRAEHGIPLDARVLGFVGRMVGDKGLGELITAWKALRDAHEECYLLLVGDYERRDRPPQPIVDSIASDPRIKHVGWLKDVAASYAAMDLFILPSYREGLATVLLEAAACGLPIVTTDAVGCRDAVDEGVSGLCVPVGDATRLRAAIENLLADAALRQKMGRAGRQWVEDNFEQSKIWARYDQLYRQWTQR